MLWDLRSGQRQRTFVGHNDWVRHAELAQEGLRVVTASQDHSLTLWEVASGKLLASFRGHTGGVYSCSVWGPYLASGTEDCTVRTWLLTP